MPRPPMTKKTECQSKLCTSQPMKGAKTTSEKYCAELKMAEAVPRSLPGNQAATSRALPGKEGLSARPTMKRMTNRPMKIMPPARKPEKPWNRVNSDHKAMAKV